MEANGRPEPRFRVVVIERPNKFAASITLTSASPDLYSPPQPAEIDLMGWAKADSYTFRNDMLDIFSGGQIVDRPRLHDSTEYGFAVEAPTAEALSTSSPLQIRPIFLGAADPCLVQVSLDAVGAASQCGPRR